MKNSSDRYGSLSIALHWLTLLLLIGVYASINLREIYPRGSDPREALRAWHFMLGLTVMLVTIVRLAARASGAALVIRPEPARWQQVSAKAMHLALYALLLGLPIAGWLALSAAGKPIPFFGLSLPALIGENKSLADTIKEVHETVGTLGYFLIGLHALAALYHHYFVKDDTMRRMLPG
jgi:superoxide oxidase